MSEEEAMRCGFVPKEEPTAAACDGVGVVQHTGRKARMGVRYVKCPKCERVWQVSFRPAAQRIIGRTPADERSAAGRPPGST